MTPTRENKSTPGSDGLRARLNGSWGKEKLSFLDDFIPPALQATGGGKRPKIQRWYVDLFAGPGLNVDPDTGEEFAGSAMRVLPMAAQASKNVHFTHAVLVNKDPLDQAALEERVSRLRQAGACPIPPNNLTFLRHDANFVIDRIMQGIDTKAYVLVFADITRPNHWPWSSVKKLKARGHESVDLYVLFPLGMALRRMMAYNTKTVEQSTESLNAFFGSSDWKDLLTFRRSDALARDLGREVLQLYMHRLKTEGWKHVIDARNIKSDGGTELYHMLYASNHPVGDKLGSWSAAQKPESPQGEFF